MASISILLCIKCQKKTKNRVKKRESHIVFGFFSPELKDFLFTSLRQASPSDWRAEFFNGHIQETVEFSDFHVIRSRPMGRLVYNKL